MTFDSSGAGVVGTGTSAEVPVPAGVAAGKVIKIELYLHNETGAVTWPAGFVQKYELATSASARGRLLIAWKRATGADSGTYTVSWTNSTIYDAHATSHTNIHSNGDPWQVSKGAESTNSTSTAPNTAGSMTTTDVCDIFAWCTNHATNAGDLSMTTPAGIMTERWDNFTQNGGVGHLGAWTQDEVAAGTVAQKGVTIAGTTGGSFPKILMAAIRVATVPQKPTVDGNANATHDAIDTSWTFPVTTDTVDSIEVRINGGTPVALGAVSTHQFMGLSPETVYAVEVRGINTVGAGPWSNPHYVLTGSTVGGITRRYFSSATDWIPPAGVTSVRRLIVGGGSSGGSGGSGGAGAGAGGVDDATESVTPGVPIPITVGKGGDPVSGSAQGIPGGSSSFGVTTVDGGGFGGLGNTSSNCNGGPGASGGGGGGTGGGGSSTTPGAATGNGDGNAGGAGYNTTINGSNRSGGGGGGATEPGANASSSVGGDGGNGVDLSSVYGTLAGDDGKFAGGGGGARGGSGGTIGAGGLGGGGIGGGSATPPGDAVPTSGSGGGGNGSGSFVSGRGADGIVIIIFEEPEEETPQKSYWGILAA